MLDTVFQGLPDHSAEHMARLSACDSLPSPPGIAEKILTLAEDHGAGISDFAEVVRVDVALTGRLLQLANSPIYALPREIYDVRHAITVLGLEATLSNALSIALISSIRQQPANGIDYRGFWRRSLASASANRLIARHVRANVPEHFFMAGLLQDIGMVALAGLDAGVYVGLGNRQADHAAALADEKAAFGFDHALAGAWLLRHWNLPERYAQAVLASHAPADIMVDSENEVLAWGTAVSGAIADIIYGPSPAIAIRRALGMGAETLRLSAGVLDTLVPKLTAELQELGKLFELDLGNDDWLAQQADRAAGELESYRQAAEPRRV